MVKKHWSPERKEKQTERQKQTKKQQLKQYS